MNVKSLFTDRGKFIFITFPAIVTLLITHISVIFLFFIEISLKEFTLIESFHSYVKNGSFISAGIAVILTSMLSIVFKPHYEFKINNRRLLIFTSFSFVFIFWGIIKLTMISAFPEKANNSILSTYVISSIITLLSLLTTLYTLNVLFDSDEAKNHLSNIKKKSEKLMNEVAKIESEDRFNDD